MPIKILATILFVLVCFPLHAHADCFKENSNWSSVEKWAWKQVCQSKKVDFNEKLNKIANINSISDWGNDRLLSAEFIHEILLDKRYANTIPSFGLRLSGFWVKAPLKLSGADIKPIIWFDNGRFEDSVSIIETRLQHTITFDGTFIGKTLHLNRTTFDGRLSINKAVIRGKTIIKNAQINHDVTMNKSLFYDDVDFEGTTFTGVLFLHGSNFNKGLNLRSNIKRRLEISSSHIKGEVDLISAEIHQFIIGESIFESKIDALNLLSNIGISIQDGAVFKGKVSFSFDNIGSLRAIGNIKFENEVVIKGNIKNDLSIIGENVVFNDTLLILLSKIDSIDFKEVTFKGKVSLLDIELSSLTINNVKFESGLISNVVQVKNSASFANSTFAKSTRIKNLRTGYHLSFRNVSSHKTLVLSSMHIGGNLWLSEGIYKDNVDLSFNNISGNLFLEGSTFTSIDLTSTKIGETLSLWSKDLPETKWEKDSVITLYNTETRVLRDHPNAWPTDTNLLYFNYGQISGSDTLAPSNARSIDWYLSWLSNNSHVYHPQPYIHLEAIFKNAGKLSNQSDIRYAREENKREQYSYQTFEYYWLTALKWFTGYGQDLGQVLIAFIILVASGIIVLVLSGENKRHSIPLDFAYSLEQALPIVNLNKQYEHIQLNTFPRYWFYFHVVAGYTLVTLLLGGILNLYT